jgi:uncharacterized ferritin-like protein (DUF455 family)
MSSDAYRDGLLGCIAARTAEAKVGILDGLLPPADGAEWPSAVPPHRPGRPSGVLEGPTPRRRKGVDSVAGLRRFLHAIWHIEMEAIDLACLMAARGQGMPSAFHADCLRVAREEAIHAGLVEGWLAAHGWPPGSEPVHHRLWEAAVGCSDLGEHLVVVPRFLEARGLDVNAGLLPRVLGVDAEAHAVLERIYRDEIGHVGTGTRWHRQWCSARGLDPEAHFAAVVQSRFADQLPSPWVLDQAGRAEAGFAAAEMALLSATPPRA